MDKRYQFRQLKHSETYGNTDTYQKKKNVFITDHLPKRFQMERKQLMLQFKLARSLNRKTTWRLKRDITIYMFTTGVGNLRSAFYFNVARV